MNEAHNIRDRRICKCAGIFLFCILNSTFSFSQENSKGEVFNYARKIVDTLASPSMHGRGYVNGGDSIAAKYISNEFQKYGLKNFGKDYYQRFYLSVNTFPGIVSLSINGKKLVLGKDFIPNPMTSSCKGHNRLLYCSKDFFKINMAIKPFALLVDTTGMKDAFQQDIFQEYRMKNKDPIIFIEKKKLTADISHRDWGFASFIVIDSIISEKVKKNYKKVSYQIESKLISQESQNIISYIKGTQFPDSFIVYTAHYDHLGVAGKNEKGKEVYFPGANDNASGCAMLLNLAKYYSTHPPKYSIAFMAFGAEEAGLVGSKFYTEHPLFPLKQIKFLVNFDIMGTGDEGIKVVNATEFNTEFNTLVKLNAQGSYVKEVSPRGKASISDHYFFTQNGVKCFYIYTLGGIKAYHDIYDRPETLPLTKFEDVFKLMVDFTNSLQTN